MSDTNILLTALASGYLYTSQQGTLNTQDLFSLPLTTTVAGKVSLNSIAVGLHHRIQGQAEVSFVDSAKPDPENERRKNQLEIVKMVIDYKQKQNAAAADLAARRRDKERLLIALDAKRAANMADMSEEELSAALAALDKG